MKVLWFLCLARDLVAHVLWFEYLQQVTIGQKIVAIVGHTASGHFFQRSLPTINSMDNFTIVRYYKPYNFN